MMPQWNHAVLFAITFLLFAIPAEADSGVFLQQKHNKYAYDGQLVKITARFSNNENSSVQTKYIVEIYSGTVLIDSLESADLLVQAGKTANLSVYYNPISWGDYTIKGYVVYGNSATQTRATTLRVVPRSSLTGSISGVPSLHCILVLSLIALSILGASFYLRKRGAA